MLYLIVFFLPLLIFVFIRCFLPVSLSLSRYVLVSFFHVYHLFFLSHFLQPKGNLRCTTSIREFEL